MQLFVYGSLLRGMSLSSYMENTKFLGPAYVKADLFYLGFYPGIISGNQTVFGELYEVNQDQLPVIDEVEDYIELDNESSAYIRKPIEAVTLADGKKVTAHAYFYNRSPEGKPRIKSGDYRRFMHSGNNQDIWLVGYASNLSSQKIKDKLGIVPKYKKGFVEGFKRVFNVETGINGNAMANLKFSGVGQKCNAVAWKLTSKQLKEFDISQTSQNNYFRISMPFTTIDGKLLHAQTYLANENRIRNNLHPDPKYVKIVNSGMKEHGFD